MESWRVARGVLWIDIVFTSNMLVGWDKWLPELDLVNRYVLHKNRQLEPETRWMKLYELALHLPTRR